MSTKVRIACRRCRAKRIKCDGGIPACSNCQKAGESCVDVDGRNNALSVPRDFAASARARIDWLEEQLHRVAPGIDLNDGPKVDFSFLAPTHNAVPSPGTYEASARANASAAATTTATATANPPPKRSYASVEELSQDQPFATEARSVALDLGLLTLNSDSRQVHYLGTSSGRLFTSLIGLGSPETAARARNSRTSSVPSQPSPSGKPGPFAQTKRLKDSCRLVYDSLRKTLPSREDAQILLTIYFQDIHVDHPFLHPASLMDALAALYQCVDADPIADIGHNGWAEGVEPFPYNGEYELSRNVNCTPVSIFTAAFHVFMVFTLAATVRTRQRMYDFAPDQFYRVATSVAQHCFSHASIATLQAILLLAVHSLLTPTEMNIWTLNYTAMAHCVDLGIHRTVNNDREISAAASITRRMVFYCVYHLDRSIATIQGRPLGIRDEAFDVQLPTLEEIQADSATVEYRDFVPEVSIPTIVAFSLHRFKLDPIISEIKLLFYHLPSQVNAFTWPTDYLALQKAIRERLENWHHGVATLVRPPTDASLMEEEQLDDAKYKLKLQSQFYAAMVLLYQPSQTIPLPSEEALLVCYQCAASRLNTHNKLYNTDSFFQSWRSVQGIFSSGATMIYCLWTSTLVQESISIASAMSDLRTCTNLLSVGGEWWPSVKRGKETFGRAMDALLTKLQLEQYKSRKNYDGEQVEKTRIRRDQLTQSNCNDNSLPFAPNTIAIERSSFMPELHSSFQVQHTDTPQFDQFPDAPAATDWTDIESGGRNEIHHDAHSFTEAFFDNTIQSTDMAVEAFISEFLHNDTAWNPF